MAILCVETIFLKVRFYELNNVGEYGKCSENVCTNCAEFCHIFIFYNLCFLIQAVEQLNLVDNLSAKCIEMLDAVVEMIKKITGTNVEHAALIASSKILTLFSRFVVNILSLAGYNIQSSFCILIYINHIVTIFLFC